MPRNRPGLILISKVSAPVVLVEGDDGATHMPPKSTAEQHLTRCLETVLSRDQRMLGCDTRGGEQAGGFETRQG